MLQLLFSNKHETCNEMLAVVDPLEESGVGGFEVLQLLLLVRVPDLNGSPQVTEPAQG